MFVALGCHQGLSKICISVSLVANVLRGFLISQVTQKIVVFLPKLADGHASLYYEDSSGDRVHRLTHMVLSGIVWKYEYLKFFYIVCLSSYFWFIVRTRQNQMGRTPSRWNALFWRMVGRVVNVPNRADHVCRVSKHGGHGVGLPTSGWKYVPCSP